MTLEQLKAKLIEFGVPAEIIKVSEEENSIRMNFKKIDHYYLEIEEDGVFVQIFKPTEHYEHDLIVSQSIINLELIKPFLQESINL